MRIIDLNGCWWMREMGAEEWIPAKVPGTVFSDLLTAGRIPDPYYRDNEDIVKKFAERGFEYNREIVVDQELLCCDHVVLSCEGLDTLAEISINGRPVAKTKNMHRRYEFEIKTLLKSGENQITIIFRSPINYITTEQLKNPLWGSSDALSGFPHLRKAHCMFGWDWGPQLPDAGIWRDIFIRGDQEGRLVETYITQHHEDAGVSLDLMVRKLLWSKDALTVYAEILTPTGETIAKSVSSTLYEDHLCFRISHPELWWPNGYGKQPLYEVKVALKNNQGSLLDLKRFTIGLRNLRIRREQDQWGESFAFEINGETIFAMGANYIPEDAILSWRSPERTEKLIQDCVAANFNMLRVWGGGFYPDDYFYDLCDRYGLIVWQDLMFACAVYDLSEEFAEEIKEEVEDNIRRIRNHSCLGLWCGNNEVEAAWAEWDFPKTVKHRRDYQQIFEVLLSQTVAETDPNTFYWPSSPSSGGGFYEANSEDKGDAHYWRVWHDLKPFADYQKRYFRFASEFGFQSFPHYRTIESFTLPEDRNIFSEIMEKHQKNGTGNAKILTYLADNHKYPTDFKSLIYSSQILQAEAIKTGVEHWRRHRGRCMGALYWQLNDCWPVASWSSVDYYGRWKALHYAAKRFFAPVLLSAVAEDDLIALYLTNEQLTPVSGTIVWRLRNNRSVILAEGNSQAQVDRLSSARGVTLDRQSMINQADPREIYLEYLFYQEGNLVSVGTMLFVKPKHFMFLDPKLTFDTCETEDRFIIILKAQAFAKYVNVELEGIDVVFSDNYFDLSAGAEKEIWVKKPEMPTKCSFDEFKGKIMITSLFEIAK